MFRLLRRLELEAYSATFLLFYVHTLHVVWIWLRSLLGSVAVLAPKDSEIYSVSPLVFELTG